MRKYFYLVLVFVALGCGRAFARSAADSSQIIRGFVIGAPKPDEVDDFIKFINNELAPRHINTLVIRIEYNYQFKSHPELRDTAALSKHDVRRIVEACRKNGIDAVPEVDLLGHQSWAGKLGKLLAVYPQFDETPWIKMPAPKDYKWPNADNLYCKSYCPLAPGLHKVLFDVVDELMDAFQSKAFHAGMDEVFYLGEDKCPRCAGRDKSVLFADEVKTIRDHLAEKGEQLWIWGDRLLDGYTTGIGKWGASYNDTYRAIDMIPRDVVIWDWQYDFDNQTDVYFALKGFRVVTCAWEKPDVAINQVNDLFRSRAQSDTVMRKRFYGIAETTWSKTGQFLKNYYADTPDRKGGDNTSWHTFKVMFARMDELEKQQATK